MPSRHDKAIKSEFMVFDIGGRFFYIRDRKPTNLLAPDGIRASCSDINDYQGGPGGTHGFVVDAVWRVAKIETANPEQVALIANPEIMGNPFVGRTDITVFVLEQVNGKKRNQLPRNNLRYAWWVTEK